MSESSTARSGSRTRLPLLSVQELAEYLGIQPTTIYHWRVRDEGPPAVLVGSRVRYRHEDVEAWLERRQTATSPIPEMKRAPGSDSERASKKADAPAQLIP